MSENSTKDNTGEKPSFRYLIIIGIIAVVIFLFLLFNSHRKRKHEEEEAKKASAPKNPIVRVVVPKKGSDTTVLMLPGNLEGIRETNLYARVPGFVKKWYVDIGDKVKEGQLLAELETPDLDQQLVQAKASQDLAKTSLDRVNSVSIPGAVSVQQKADREGAYKTASAQVSQLEAQKSFKNVIAPFDGVITARNIDIGSLINAGNAQSQQLFSIAQIRRLRIFVNVPQTYSESIHIGTNARIIVQELGGNTRIGSVTRTAGALNPDTRTLRTQVEFDNTDRLYLPGMYANVKFNVPQLSVPVIIPGNTLMLVTGGPQVVTVTKDSVIAILPVVIGKDNGATLEISSGLSGHEMLVTNPTLNMTNGLKVTIAKPAKPLRHHADAPTNTEINAAEKKPKTDDPAQQKKK